MEREDPQRLEIVVSGRVQGVAFRWHTQRMARQLGLTGWVRNQPDGSVRLVAEGPHDRLLALLQWARRGPDRARVDGCRHLWQERGGQYADFEIAG